MHNYENMTLGKLPESWGRFNTNDWRREVSSNLVKIDLPSKADFDVFQSKVL
jgi:hypothetical protein